VDRAPTWAISISFWISICLGNACRLPCAVAFDPTHVVLASVCPSAQKIDDEIDHRQWTDLSTTVLLWFVHVLQHDQHSQMKQTQHFLWKMIAK